MARGEAESVFIFRCGDPACRHSEWVFCDFDWKSDHPYPNPQPPEGWERHDDRGFLCPAHAALEWVGPERKKKTAAAKQTDLVCNPPRPFSAEIA